MPDFLIEKDQKDQKDEKSGTLSPPDTELNDETLSIYSLQTGLISPSFTSSNLLRDNSSRVERIIEDISTLDQRFDALHFQGVDDAASEEVLVSRLRKKFPYVVRKIGASCSFSPIKPSGLLCFYKHPIEETEFVRFHHNMIGEESFINKGALLTKIQKGGKVYLVANVDTSSSEDAIFKKSQEKYGGNTRVRRAKQAGQLHRALKRKEREGLPPNATIISGGMNMHLETHRKLRGISLGKRYRKGDHSAPTPRSKKYIPFAEFMRDMNAVNPYHIQSDEKHRYKNARTPMNFDRLAKLDSKEHGDDSELTDVDHKTIPVYTGTTIAKTSLQRCRIDQSNSRNQVETEYKLIDGIFARDPHLQREEKKEEKSPSFQPSETIHIQTMIHQIGTGGASNHHAVIGFTTINPEQTQRVHTLLLEMAQREPGSTREPKNILRTIGILNYIRMYYQLSSTLGRFLIGACILTGVLGLCLVLATGIGAAIVGGAAVTAVFITVASSAISIGTTGVATATAAGLGSIGASSSTGTIFGILAQGVTNSALASVAQYSYRKYHAELDETLMEPVALVRPEDSFTSEQKESTPARTMRR